MKKQRKKYPLSAHLIAIALGAVIGVAIGFALGPVLDALGAGESAGGTLIGLGAALIALAALYFVTVVVHEAGHLAFGLATGWRFVSFRVGSFILVRQSGRFALRRYTVAGTGGQCLLEPPSDDPPMLLYNLGGPLVNLAQGLLLLVPASGVPRVLCVTAGALGLLTGAFNLLPFRRLPTDGGNLLRLKKDARTRRSFVRMTRVNALLTRGEPLRDAPADWFPEGLPADDEEAFILTDYIAAADRVFSRGEYEAALDRYAYMLERCKNLYPMHQSELRCYVLMLEYALRGDTDRAKMLDTKELRRYEAATAVYPARAALAAVRARAKGEDDAKALAAFEKTAARSPHPGDAADLRRFLEDTAKEPAL